MPDESAAMLAIRPTAETVAHGLAASCPDEGAPIRRLEAWIGHTQRYGAILAALVILFGCGALLVAGQAADGPHSLGELLVQQSAGRPILPSALGGVHGLHALAFANAGILILILTPLVRVAMTVILFLPRREWALAAVSTIVLLVLIAGISGLGGGHGL